MMPYTSDGVGHQNTDTSEAAARDIAAKAATLRAEVTALLRENPPGLDTEETAERRSMPTSRRWGG